MNVNEIMTKNPACATPETSLREIAQMMVEHDCGYVPIVENQTSKKPIGTITDRDITIRAFATGQNPAELKASDVMTMGVTTINPDASVQECADTMEDKKIRRVVVVDNDGKCVGIVAQADVAEYGPNPNLISEVVHEISDAPASPNRGVYNRMRNNQSYSPSRTNSFSEQPRPNRFRSHKGSVKSGTFQSKRSQIKEEESSYGVGTLLPLLAGIGISFAAKYYFGASEKPLRRALPQRPMENSFDYQSRSTDEFGATETETAADSAVSRSGMSRSASASGSKSATRH